MLKNLSISLFLIHLSLSLGNLATTIWTENTTNIFTAQQTSLPDDRESQEAPESKDLTSEYCPKNTLGFAVISVVNLYTQHFFDQSAPWLIQTEGEIHTPPPDQC